MPEVEAKFRVSGHFRLPELDGGRTPVHRVDPPRRLQLRATYHDTADLRLARWGVTLRHRVGGDDDGWTLKLPAGAPGAREELTADGAPGRVPIELRELATAFSRGAPLRVVARLDTDRVVRVLRDEAGAPLGELVDDTVSVADGRRVVATFREIEVEAAPELADPDRLLAPLAEVLGEAGAVGGEFVPKAVRALGPAAAEPPEPPPPAPVGPKDPAGAAVRAYLRTQVRALLLQDAAVRRDLPDAVHQMRVAARRLRSGLRVFAPLLDADAAAEVSGELRELAGALGEVRDREVLLARLEHAVDALDPELVPGERAEVTRPLADELAAGRERVLAVLRAPRYLRLLDALVALATDPPLAAAAAEPARSALPPLAATAWRDLAKRADRLRGRDPDEAYHRVRIAAKRARYAAEACAVALGAPAKRYAAAVAGVQEVLGEHQDAAVAAAYLRDTATGPDTSGATGFTLGVLHERQRDAARTARREFKQAWRAASRSTLRRWLG